MSGTFQHIFFPQKTIYTTKWKQSERTFIQLKLNYHVKLVLHLQIYLNMPLLIVTGEHLYRSLVSIKLESNFIKLQSKFIEISLWYRHSPKDFLCIFRTPFYKNTYAGLLLKMVTKKNCKYTQFGMSYSSSLSFFKNLLFENQEKSVSDLFL